MGVKAAWIEEELALCFSDTTVAEVGQAELCEVQGAFHWAVVTLNTGLPVRPW